MPSHWGHTALNIVVAGSSPTGTQCLHAVGSRRSRRDLRARRRRFADRESRFHADEVTYVSLGEGATSEGEFWEVAQHGLHRAAAGALPGRRQRLRDLGAGRSADAGRRHLAARASRFPDLHVDSLRRHRLPRQPTARCAKPSRYVARAQGPGARPRQGHPPVLALAVRRREAVQDAGGARGRSAARSAHAVRASSCSSERPRDRRRPRRASPRTSTARSTRRPTQALEAPKPARDTAALCASTRRTSIRRPPRSTRRPQPEGKPDTMVGGDQPHAEGRDGARTRASSSSARTSPTPAARTRSTNVPGKGGVFKVTHGLQRRLRRRSRLQLAARRSQHRRPRRRHGDARAEAGRRDPVLRLHLAGDDADPRRAVDAALPVGQQLVVPDGHPRADRRLPARRRAVPQPVGREHLRALPGHPHRRSRRTRVDAAGLLRTAIRCDDPVLFLEHKHLYRQTYNKGEYPGRGLHDPVRQGARCAARAPTWWSSPGARWCSARCSRRSRPRRTASASAVLDLRTIVPYDWDAIAALRRSARTASIVAHEDQLTCGFGAEIAARIADELFEHLDAPVRRVAALDSPGRLLPGPRRSDPAADRPTS